MAIETIIELYDEEPIFNILAVSSLRPQNVVFLGGKLMRPQCRERLIRWMRAENLPVKPYFFSIDANRIPSLVQRMEEITARFPNSILDITGGSSPMLFASGIFCRESGMPVIVYEKEKERFLNVQNCPQAAEFPGSVRFRAEDFLILAGGSFPRCGHISGKEIVGEMETLVRRIWNLYQAYFLDWNAHVQYLQAVSGGEENRTLRVDAPLQFKGTDGRKKKCFPEILRKLEEAGAILDLKFRRSRVSFSYKSHLLRNCLCDIGIWLELHLYLTARDSGYFDDVQVSVVIDWEGEEGKGPGTQNEVDLILTKGSTPVFISCKTGTPNTQALNELQVLTERYGGYWAKGVLATMSRLSRANPAVYRRAADMGIYVLQQEDLLGNDLAEKLKRIVKSRG